MLYRLSLVAAALVLGLAGCNGADERPDDGLTQVGSDRPSGPVRMKDDSFNEDRYTRRDLDLNSDGIPDAHQWSFVEDDKRVVVRKEIDVNFDGKIDLVRNFNDRGDLLEERLDADFDGRIDIVNFFEKGKIVRKEYDTNFDSNVDVWRYFENGVIDRKEADLDHDGRLDYWEYYERGKIDRVGIDRDGDGEVDEWEVSNRSEG